MGLSWPSGKVLTNYTSVINVVVCRFILVAPAMCLILLFLKVSIRVKKAGIPAILASGILLALYSYFSFKGLKCGAAGAGGVLVTTLNPIMAYTLGIFLNRKLPSGHESIGLLLGLTAGIILLKVWDNPGTVFESGNLYFLMAALTWAVMSKITSRGARYGSSMGFSLWQYVVTLLCLLPLMDKQELVAVARIRETVFWANLFFSSVIVTSLATTIYFYTTTRLGAEKASSFIFLVPLAAAVSSWLFLGERVLPHTVIGGALGMVAVYIINRRKIVVNG